jgi:hypothetical protein
MAIEPTRAEEDLWKFALVCTNDSIGAARVLASLVRDHRELARLSETRLRRAVLERSRLWLERSRDADVETAEPAAPALVRFGCEDRAILWLAGVLGLGVVEMSHALQLEPSEIRKRMDRLESDIDGGVGSLASTLEASISTAPREELSERLTAARRVSGRRNRRRAILILVGFAVFVGLMLYVMVDLLNWQDASQTLPDRTGQPVQRGFSP